MLCENEMKKLRSPVPAVGKQNATFSPYFTQPGVHLLEMPCIGFSTETILN